MSEFERLTDAVLRFRRERDWDKFHSAKEDAIDLSVEASEVLEHFQWKNGPELEEYLRTHREEISDELGDVLYSLLAVADSLKIDLREAFAKKMEKNARKYPIEKSKGRHTKYTELS